MKNFTINRALAAKKKIFLFAALIISASMMAQKNINWYSAIESNASNGTVAVGNSSLKSISAYADGSVVAAGSFASCQSTPATATWFDKSFVGAPYTVNMNTTNNNVLVAKLNKSGAVQWLIHSDRGNGDAIAIATADGGALVFATVGHTDSDIQGDHKNLQLKNGSTELLAATHDFNTKTFKFGELVKIAADGQSASLVGELLNTGTNDGFTAQNWATDGNFYYLLVRIFKEVKYGETSITPYTGGSLAIFKFDQTGDLKGYVLTDKLAFTSGVMACDAEKIYVGSVVSINSINSILMKTYKNDLSLEREDTIKGKVVNTKNQLQLKAMMVKDGELFAAGSVNGGIEVEGGDIENSINKLLGVAVKYDFASRKATKAYMHNSTNIGCMTDMFVLKNQLFVYGYDWANTTGEGLYLIQFDANLAAVDTIGLFKTNGSENSWNAVNADGNIVLAANTAANKDLKFTADDTKSVKTSTLSRILAGITLGEPVPTAVENVETKAVKAQKVVRNGQVLILRDGKVYNVLGARID